MASTDRRSDRDLIAEIGEQGPRFGFFQAVRLLALSAGEQGVPAGLRFGTPLSLAFPASEIVAAQARATATAPEDGADPPPEALHLSIGFMGMTGPSAALPVAYTETLIERRNIHRDTAGHAFLDMFTHRAAALFYDAWRKYRFYVDYEAGERDGFTRNTLDLVGTGLPSMARIAGESTIPPALLSYFAGLLSQRPISATNLGRLLRAYFQAPVEIEQFVGQWIVVPPDEQTRLGKGGSALGHTCIAGERTWDRQNKMTIRIGPLDSHQFADFLPGRAASLALRQMVQLCVGHTLACDVSLVLKRESVPRPALATTEGAQLQLGYNTWLHQCPPEIDQQDACFSVLN